MTDLVFHYIGLMPQSWPQFGINCRGVDYIWTTLPFSWNQSPYIYSTLSEAKAQYRPRQGIPALSYDDDSWIGTLISAKQSSPQIQWVETARALMTGVELTFLCSYYLSSTECDLVPTETLSYLDIIRDNRQAVFRVPQDKLEKLQASIDMILPDKAVSVTTFRKIAGKCMSLKVAIQPSALLMHFMLQKFATKHVGQRVIK